MGVSLHNQSIGEYLAWESWQAGRNEFWRGEVFAMVGGKRGHGEVIANLMRRLGNHLDATRIRGGVRLLCSCRREPA